MFTIVVSLSYVQQLICFGSKFDLLIFNLINILSKSYDKYIIVYLDTCNLILYVANYQVNR